MANINPKARTVQPMASESKRMLLLPLLRTLRKSKRSHGLRQRSAKVPQVSWFAAFLSNPTVQALANEEKVRTSRAEPRNRASKGLCGLRVTQGLLVKTSMAARLKSSSYHIYDLRMFAGPDREPRRSQDHLFVPGVPEAIGDRPACVVADISFRKRSLIEAGALANTFARTSRRRTRPRSSPSNSGVSSFLCICQRRYRQCLLPAFDRPSRSRRS